MSETPLEVGDRVRTVNIPSEFQRESFGSEPSEVVGTVTDIVDETKELSPNNTMEQTMVIIEGDDGEEKRVNIEYLNAEIEGEDGGVTIQILDDEGEDEEDDEDEPEIATDGGEDVTDDVSDIEEGDYIIGESGKYEVAEIDRGREEPIKLVPVGEPQETIREPGADAGWTADKDIAIPGYIVERDAVESMSLSDGDQVRWEFDRDDVDAVIATVKIEDDGSVRTENDSIYAQDEWPDLLTLKCEIASGFGEIVGDDDEDGPETATDGGEDVTADLSDEDIEETIAKKDDPDHPDAATVAEVRDVLARINNDVLDWWSEHQDAIDDGAHEIVHEDRNVIVLADHSGHFWREQLDAIDAEGPLRNVITSLHHTMARQHCDLSWSAVSPIVVQKTADFRAGEQQVLREIARRTEKFGSVARAVDTLATENHGWSKSTWAKRTDRNPSTVTRTTDN